MDNYLHTLKKESIYEPLGFTVVPGEHEVQPSNETSSPAVVDEMPNDNFTQTAALDSGYERPLKIIARKYRLRKG